MRLAPLDLSDVFGPSILVLVYPNQGFRVSIKLDIDHSFDTTVITKDKICVDQKFGHLFTLKKNSHVLENKVNLHELKKTLSALALCNRYADYL